MIVILLQILGIFYDFQRFPYWLRTGKNMNVQISRVLIKKKKFSFSVLVKQRPWSWWREPGGNKKQLLDSFVLLIDLYMILYTTKNWEDATPKKGIKIKITPKMPLPKDNLFYVLESVFSDFSIHTPIQTHSHLFKGTRACHFFFLPSIMKST